MSQPPERHEPDTPGELQFDVSGERRRQLCTGVLHFQYIFDLIRELRLDCLIGAEYSEVHDNAQWVQKYKLSW